MNKQKFEKIFSGRCNMDDFTTAYFTKESQSIERNFARRLGLSDADMREIGKCADQGRTWDVPSTRRAGFSREKIEKAWAEAELQTIKEFALAYIAISPRSPYPQYIRDVIRLAGDDSTFFIGMAQAINGERSPLFNEFECLLLRGWRRFCIFGERVPGFRYWTFSAVANYANQVRPLLFKKRSSDVSADAIEKAVSRMGLEKSETHRVTKCEAVRNSDVGGKLLGFRLMIDGATKKIKNLSGQ